MKLVTGSRGWRCRALALGVVCTVSLRASTARADEWLSADKGLHFGASALIVGGGYGLSAPFFEHSRLPPLLIGAGVGVLAGVGKELYDATGRGDPSAKDLVWDGLGITTGLLVAVGIDLLVRGWSLEPKPGPAPVQSVGSGLLVRF